MKKKICLFLGSRANYSSLRPIMKKIQNDPDLDLVLFVGASALLDKYGEVALLVEKDGFKIDEYVYMVVDGQNPTTMAKTTGLGLIELPNLLHKHKPDLTLIIGDRHEMLAMAIASAFMNIPVAHTMGGEVSGTIDESTRHAITKLSHIHFPANEDARERIIKMGENPEFIFNVGCPRMDTIKELILDSHNYSNYEEQIESSLIGEGVGDMLDVNEDFIMMLQHPVTTEYGRGEQQINETMNAIFEIQQENGLAAIILWPNPDAGSDDIARGIRKLREKYELKKTHFFKNLSFPLYVYLMNKTKCLVGNSSSGIREGAFLGTPVVNIGTRQAGRLCSKNVLHVGYNKEEIKSAIQKQLSVGKYESEQIYGGGDASQKIVDILKKAEPSIQKRLHY